MSLIETVLKSASQLPPFPVVIQRALQIIDDPKRSVQDIVDVIQYDPSITMNVLKLCNSAHFGLRRSVYSLRDALVLIGFNQLLEIILSQASLRFLSSACKGYGLESGELWKHSLACALLSGIISKRLNREAKTAHFTAALLHDIGKILLSQHVNDYFENIKEAIQRDHLSFSEAEKMVLGIDHAEIGAWIIEQWAFPKMIVSAVRYHHAPFLISEDQEFNLLIYLCDLVTIITGIGGGVDGLSYHAYGEVMRQFGLREKDIDQFIIQLEDQFQKVGKLLDIHSTFFYSHLPNTSLGERGQTED